MKPAEQVEQVSQVGQTEHPEGQGRHLSCCWSQAVPTGQKGTAPPLEGVDGLAGVEGVVLLVAGVVGTTGTGMATQAVPFHTCPAVQVTHVTPL